MEGISVPGGVCIFTSLDVPSSALPLHTSLQAVAVRIHSTSLITVCCLYLPPNTVIHQHDLNNLVDQLPAPFVILGDFNGHSTLRGSAKTNLRGRQIEQAKANARRVRRRSQRQSWIRYVSSLTSSMSSKQLWRKVKAANGKYRKFSFPILQTSNSVFSSPVEIANILAVRYFYVRIGHSSSHKFMQDQGVPQGSVLSVTLFNIHMSNILHQLPPSVKGMLNVDDLQVSCQGSDMRLIERQLQRTVNRLVK
ncbi:putative RNA-directed DNA polymerase from transposon BS [Trichonephila clavipes]|nr:putative RNA-directed DNA polymerase from transposon BS [Trichonephila clavipes]